MAQQVRARRAKREIRMPTRYSKEYPVAEGHDYLVRSIPSSLWRRVLSRADREDVSIRVVLIRSLERYAARGMPEDI